MLAERDLPTAAEIRESVTNPNTWHRRFFRCWIDGSYLGEWHYRENRADARRYYHNDKVLRACAINWFCDFIAHEESCPVRTVQRHMVDTVPRDVLEALNVELIDDIRELVRDEMEVA